MKRVLLSLLGTLSVIALFVFIVFGLWQLADYVDEVTGSSWLGSLVFICPVISIWFAIIFDLCYKYFGRNNNEMGK